MGRTGDVARATQKYSPIRTLQQGDRPLRASNNKLSCASIDHHPPHPRRMGKAVKWQLLEGMFKGITNFGADRKTQKNRVWKPTLLLAQLRHFGPYKNRHKNKDRHRTDSASLVHRVCGKRREKFTIRARKRKASAKEGVPGAVSLLSAAAGAAAGADAHAGTVRPRKENENENARVDRRRHTKASHTLHRGVFAVRAKAASGRQIAVIVVGS